jgi:hypothetical protein
MIEVILDLANRIHIELNTTRMARATSYTPIEDTLLVLNIKAFFPKRVAARITIRNANIYTRYDLIDPFIYVFVNL